jgi:hypothetical protein
LSRTLPERYLNVWLDTGATAAPPPALREEVRKAM